MQAKQLELVIQKIVFSCRWLQAPIYLLLTCILFVFIYEIGEQTLSLFFKLSSVNESILILKALSLCDMVLIANLLVIVIINGYENFVGKLNIEGGKGEPMWIKDLSHGGVKMKIAVSLIAISSIQLLKQFLDIPRTDESSLKWFVIVHFTFVFSALGVAIVERIHAGTHHSTVSKH